MGPKQQQLQETELRPGIDYWEPQKFIPGGRSERWCFTSPRGEQQIEEQLIRLEQNPEVKILIAGAETGSRTGYQHYQGFVMFYNQKSFKQVKALLTDKTHLEKTEGTTNKAIQYCMKEGQVKYHKNVNETNQGKSLDTAEKREQKETKEHEK
jgi:hypothetical protein